MNTVETLKTLDSIIDDKNKVSYKNCEAILVMETPVTMTGTSEWMYSNTVYVIPDEVLDELLNNPQDFNLDTLVKESIKFSILDQDSTVAICKQVDSYLYLEYKGFTEKSKYSQSYIEEYFDLVKSSDDYSDSERKYTRLYKVKPEKLKNLVSLKLHIEYNSSDDYTYSVDSTPELIDRYEKISNSNLDWKNTIDDKIDILIETFRLYSNNRESREALMDLQLPFFLQDYRNRVLALDSPNQVDNPNIVFAQEHTDNNLSFRLAILNEDIIRKLDNKVIGLLDLRLYRE